MAVRRLVVPPADAPDAPQYSCEIYTESLAQYKPGGLHPVHLGDTLQDGRYKIVHKLGWGGYSTVWLANDQRDKKYVAIKIVEAEQYDRSREVHNLRKLAELPSCHPGHAHLPRLFDDFDISGPNGVHRCLVTDVLGANVQELLGDQVSSNKRLPGKLAKRFAKQALLALDCLHTHGIIHGDLHTRNLAWIAPNLDSLSEKTILSRFGRPDIGYVRSKDGAELEPSIPRYQMVAEYYPVKIWQETDDIKIIDFGEAFLASKSPLVLNNPLVFRPPEAVLGDKLDHSVDLWAMACMLFELITGQPPFGGLLLRTPDLVRQMLEMTGDTLPERWQDAWQKMQAEEREATAWDHVEHDPPMRLQAWLEDVYFKDIHKTDLSRDDIAEAGKIINSMLRLEPGERASVKEVLANPWFDDV